MTKLSWQVNILVIRFKFKNLFSINKEITIIAVYNGLSLDLSTLCDVQLGTFKLCLFLILTYQVLVDKKRVL